MLPALPDQLLARADDQRPRRNADLGKNVAREMGDQRMIDAQGAFEMAAAASGAVVKRCRHFLDFLIRQPRIAQQASPQHSRDSEMAPVDGKQQLRPVAGHVAGIAGCPIHLARHTAAGALGADADVVIERDPVVGVLQDGGKGLQKTPGAILKVEIFNVIPNRKTLPLNDLGLLRTGERLLPLLSAYRLHRISW